MKSARRPDPQPQGKPQVEVEGVLIVSPAEPRWLKTKLEAMFPDVQYNALPERRGVDVCWRSLGAWWGVQRKQLDDLVSSLSDGRLQREVAMMTADSGVTMPHLIVEGQVRFTSEGMLIRDGWGQDFTKRQWRGLLWSLQQTGVAVSYAPTPADTAELIWDLHAWSRKARHGTLRSRPGPASSEWGTRSSASWQRHLLQGFDGIGPELADAMIQRFGGAPMAWTVDADELRMVPGIGPKRAEALVRALDKLPTSLSAGEL